MPRRRRRQGGWGVGGGGGGEGGGRWAPGGGGGGSSSSGGGPSWASSKEPPSVSDEDLQRRIKLVGAAFPDVKKSPDVLVALAQQDIPDDELVASAAKTSAWAGARKQATALGKLPKSKQREAWDALDKEQRATVRSFGYKPPKGTSKDDDDDGGWLGALQDIGSDIVDAVPVVGAIKAFTEGDTGKGLLRLTPAGMFGQPAFTALKQGQRGLGAYDDFQKDKNPLYRAERGSRVGKAAGKVLGLPGEASDWAVEHVGRPALNALEVAGDLPFHAYRAGTFLSEERQGYIDLENLGDAWSETSDPNATFHADAKGKAKDELNGNRRLYKLAEGFASGKTIEDLIQDPKKLGFKNRQDAYLTISGLTGSPKFQKAVNTLTNRRVSPGADIVSSAGFDLDSPGGTAVSTSADLALSFALDPFLIAGKARKAYGLAKYGLRTDDIIGGVAMKETTETARLTQMFGEDWATKAAEGAITPRDMARAGATHSAFAEDVAGAFRANHTWKAARAVGDEEELARVGNPLAELLNRHNRLRPAIDDLLKWDRTLRTRKTNDLTKRLIVEEGRMPTQAEQAAVRGIESAADLWDFYGDAQGRLSLISGRFARPTAQFIELPRLTRTGMAKVQAKIGMEKAIDFAAGRLPNTGVALGPEDIVGGEDKIRTAAEALPDVAEGHTRLYRVQSGPGLDGARHGVPDYVLNNRDRLGFEKAAGRWFTSDLERARAEAAQLGPNGRLYVHDVPDDVADAARFANNPEIAQLASSPTSEFHLADDAARGARPVGRIGDYADVNGKVLPAPFRWLLSPPARLIQSMAHRVPEGRNLPLHGPGFGTEIGRFLDVGLTGSAKDRMLQEIIAAENPVARRQLARAAMDRVFWTNGVYETPEGSAVAEKYLNGVQQQYASNGSDIMIQGTEPARAGMLPVADHADGIAMPSFRDVMAQSQHTSFTRTIFGGINTEQVDAFMGSYWKPAVLFRLGFVPRAAADEMLSAVLRMPEMLNPVRPVARRIAAKEGEPTFLNHMVAGVARGIQSHLPESALDDSVPWLERFAQFMDNRASGWVRGMAARTAKPEELEFARVIARDPAVQRAFAEEFTGIPGGRAGVSAEHSSFLSDEELGRQVGGIMSIPIDPDNPEARVALRTISSEVIDYTGHDAAFRNMFNYQANRFFGDPVGQAAAQAMSVYVHPDQAATLDGQLHATRRTLTGTTAEGFATDFFDAVGDNPARAVTNIRTALAQAPHEVRNPMVRFYNLSGSDDPDTLARAGAALGEAKEAAYNTRDPNLVMFTETVDRLPQDLRWSLSVDRDAVLNRLRPTPARDADKVKPVAEEAPAFSAREQRWADLADQAEAGEWTAARDLARYATFRELQNPAHSRYVRESMRSQMMRGGTPVASPVEEGMTRVYFPVVDGGSVGYVQDTLRQGSRIGRQYVDQALDPNRQATIARDLETGAQPGFVPASRYATTDFDEAVDLNTEIGRALSQRPSSHTQLHYVDVPDTNLSEFDRVAKMEGRARGTHEYALAEGEAYRGKPMDPTGPVERIDGAAVPGVTVDAALNDWADALVGHASDLFRSPRNGRVLHEVAARGAQDGGFQYDWLVRQGPAAEDLPTSVLGPKLVYPTDNAISKATRFGFDKIISPGINAMSRQPLWFKYAARRWQASKEGLLPLLIDDEAVGNAARIAERVGFDDINDLRAAWDQVPSDIQKLTRWDTADVIKNVPKSLRGLEPDDVAAVRAWVKNQDYALGEAAQRAAEGAFRDMTPFVDDHRIRSQYADYVRNVVPFWFAEEQFLKRWALTLVHSPEGLRRAQLLMGAGKHFGLIQQNEYGEDVFVYPGSAQLQQLLTSVAESVTGQPYTLPIEVPLTGQLQYATPGFDRLGVPGYSPLVSIPMSLLKRRFPELASSQESALGRGSGSSIVDQIIPASVMRFYRAVTGNADRDAQYGSAMIQAMQVLEANHLTPAEDAKPGEWARYNDRVENWTRMLLITRGIVSFTGPAAAQPAFPGTELAQEYRQMLKTLPIEEASAEFMRKHPDASPYTVFTTKSKSGAPLPPTKKALDFMTHNEELIADYPEAAAWLLPQSDADKPADRSAFAQQIQQGLKERKTPEEWQTDFFFQRAADLYFNSRDRYEIARQATTSSKKRADLDDRWREWKDGYFKQHPVFAEQLQSRDAHNRRMKTIDQMKTLLNDKRLPKDIEHAPEVRTMVDSWSKFDSAMQEIRGDRRESAQEKRKNLRIAFSQWGQAYTRRHRRVRSLWQRVFEREIGLDAGDLTEGM